MDITPRCGICRYYHALNSRTQIGICQWAKEHLPTDSARPYWWDADYDIVEFDDSPCATFFHATSGIGPTRG